MIGFDDALPGMIVGDKKTVISTGYLWSAQ
ncbi:MAG: hypothetical protein U0T56_03875 [Ferruginibacter sp.]